MTEEWRHCDEVMKEHFNKELVTTKKDDEDVESSTKCWICGNTFVDGDVKVGFSPSNKRVVLIASIKTL